MNNQNESAIWLIRPINKEFVENSPECQRIIEKLREIQVFIGKYGFLIFERSGILLSSNGKNLCFSTNNIMTSLELTMGSVISCCKNACIADANTLLRKYRDDLFFYLYIQVYNGLDKNSTQAKRMKSKIEEWLNNKLKKLKITEVLADIGKIPQNNNLIKKYDLKTSFDNIGGELNNFVHSNGYVYYNQNVNGYKPGDLICKLKSIDEYARKITTVFLVLLIICSPSSVMSEDYTDYLDFNETPPEESKYWVADFIENFLKENISIIDENCLNYLRQNTKMQI